MTGIGNGAKRSCLSPLGAWNFLAAAVALVILLCIYYDWLPFGQNLTGPDKMLYGISATAVLVISSMAWATRVLYLIGRDRSWSWKVLALPSAFLAAMLVVLVYQKNSFANAEESLRSVANEILVGPPGTIKRGFSVEGIEVSIATRGPGRSIYFYDADGYIGNSARGWVYSQGEPPVGGDDITFEQLTEGWYEFTVQY